MKGKNMVTIVGMAVVLALLGAGAAISAQDRYTLKVPGGLAFSEFRGYEGWQTIAACHTVAKNQDFVFTAYGKR
jgi:hypothetical protein